MLEVTGKTAGGVLKLVIAMMLVLGLLLLTYGGWAWWDIHRLRAFCSDLRPGTPVVNLPQFAAQHGIASHWVQGPGIFVQSTNNWFLPVPASSTMGEVICAIHHDRDTVVSAIMNNESQSMQ